MAELEPGRLIQKTRELVAESKELHDRSCRAITESNRLKKRLAKFRRSLAPQPRKGVPEK